MIFTFVIISRRYFFISLQPKFSEMDFIAVLKKSLGGIANENDHYQRSPDRHGS